MSRAGKGPGYRARTARASGSGALAASLSSRRALFGQALQFGSASVAGLLLGRSERALAVPRIAQADSNRLTVIYNHNQFELDPHAVFGDSSIVLLGPYEMLIQLQGSSANEYAPMLAESWDANADRSSYTFRLSSGALFHDGSPCDAAAVKASFIRFLELAAGSVYIVSRFVQDPDQIVVVDEHTFRFDLGRPQPLFLAAMASPFGPFVVNPRVVDAHGTTGDPWAHEWLRENSAGAGTGPYEVTSHLPNEQTVLRRFDRYHRGWSGSHFEEVVIRVVGEEATRRDLLTRGEADIITRLLKPSDVAALAEMPDLRVSTYDSFDVGWIVMNAPRLRTAAVRQGFSYAFPYDDVISGVEGGLRKRTGPIPAGMLGYDPDVFLYPTDLARARELILSGGFAEGDVFDYVYVAGSESSRATAELFQANVQAIGFSLDVQEVDQATLFDIGFGELPAEERPAFLGSWGWYPDYNDPWVQLAPCFRRSYVEGGEGTANPGLWANDWFEQVMTEAAIAPDEAQLITLMKESQRILTREDPPCIYLGQQRYVTVLASDIGGFAGNPLYLNLYRYYDLHPTTG